MALIPNHWHVRDSTRRVPVDYDSVRRTESRARELRGARGRLGLGFGPRAAGFGRATSLADCANRSAHSTPMAFLGEHGRVGNRTESLASLHSRGLPCGNDRWVRKSTVRLSLESTIKPRDRPRKRDLQPLFFPREVQTRLLRRRGGVRADSKLVVLAGGQRRNLESGHPTARFRGSIGAIDVNVSWSRTGPSS